MYTSDKEVDEGYESLEAGYIPLYSKAEGKPN